MSALRIIFISRIEAVIKISEDGTMTYIITGASALDKTEKIDTAANLKNL
jgi:hypothetical protein